VRDMGPFPVEPAVLRGDMLWSARVPASTGCRLTRQPANPSDKSDKSDWSDHPRCRSITARRVATPSRRASGVRLAEREFRRKPSWTTISLPSKAERPAVVATEGPPPRRNALGQAYPGGKAEGVPTDLERT
jgi:hypothetical protein